MKKRVSFTIENARSKDLIVRIPVSQKSAAEEANFDKDYYMAGGFSYVEDGSVEAAADLLPPANYEEDSN